MATHIILLLTIITTVPCTAYDHYLLSCGAPSSVANSPSSYDTRTWHTDNNSTFSNNFSSTSTAPLSNVPQIPFSTARVFTTNFTYSFPVSPGPKFIRLFFYSSFSSSSSYLTLESNTGHLLLRNFSAYLSSNSSYMFKEFYLHVDTSPLQLSFSPTSPSTQAFINGIEIVSVPDTLYVGPTNPIFVSDTKIEFDYMTNSTALETAYRLNVGGAEVGFAQDSGSMYRRWDSDDDYLIGNFSSSTALNDQAVIKYTAATPNYSAPVMVYDTFRLIGVMSNEEDMKPNLTWGFEVDLDFLYMLRLHWCDVSVDFNVKGAIRFDIYINQLMVNDEVDIFERVGAYTPMYMDYVVYMGYKESGNRRRGNLQLALHPSNSRSMYRDVMLNGLEMFKLSRVNSSLDAPNPNIQTIPTSVKRPPSTAPPKSSPHKFLLILGAIVVTIFILVLLLLLVTRKNKWFKLSTETGSSSGTRKLLTSKTNAESSSQSTKQGRVFMLSEIRSATDDFNDALIIGIGGFGIVYVGTLDSDHGSLKVAIKRLKPSSKQGTKEFRTEIDMLSILQHDHLVRLIGYCDEHDEMILVYECMECGTLRDHLYDTDNSPLSWTQRHEILVGAAKGLNYLHEGGKHKIIHRDIKSSNILLDEKLVAKVSDFGLSIVGPMSEEFDHISTRVKGSMGYVDPEYYRRRQVTEKSDVYSFGVVMFEVLCGRPAVNPNLPKEEMNLAVWARINQKRGCLDEIVDPYMKGQIEAESLRKFGEIAESCVRNSGIDRPSMADVLQALHNV